MILNIFLFLFLVYAVSAVACGLIFRTNYHTISELLDVYNDGSETPISIDLICKMSYVPVLNTILVFDYLVGKLRGKP